MKEFCRSHCGEFQINCWRSVYFPQISREKGIASRALEFFLAVMQLVTTLRTEASGRTLSCLWESCTVEKDTCPTDTKEGVKKTKNVSPPNFRRLGLGCIDMAFLQANCGLWFRPPGPLRRDRQQTWAGPRFIAGTAGRQRGL